MSKKAPGKPEKIPGLLQAPPAAEEFGKVPLGKYCRPVEGVFYRLHQRHRSAVFFSREGSSRFDPPEGPGTFYVAGSLAGAILEIFDDHWGPVGSPNRSLTQSELQTWCVTLVSLPKLTVFDTGRRAALSKVGTDAQLITGDHATARRWARRFAEHPAEIDGIRFASRHDHIKRNLAIFQRASLLPACEDRNLLADKSTEWKRLKRYGSRVVFGPPVLLSDHPGLMKALIDLEAGIVP